MNENTKIKIIHLLMTNSYSGAEKVVIDLIQNINNENVECWYVSKDGPIREILEEKGIPYFLLGEVNRKSLKNAIKILKPNLIHSHDFKASILSSQMKKNIPIISHIHQNPSWIKKINFKSIAFLLTIKRYSKVLSVSNSFFDEYIFSNYIHDRENIGNIIDISNMRKNINKNVFKDIDIIYVGRLSKEKNPLKCIRIIEKICENNNKLRCAIVGNGPLYKECESYILKNSLEKNIQMYGFQKDVSIFFNRSKISINTSLWEGFGLSIVESLSFGLPVVCSNVGGLINIVNDLCGKLCSNDEDFVNELVRLIEDKSYYETKSKNALIRSEMLNNVDEYTSKMRNLYIEILERNEHL